MPFFSAAIATRQANERFDGSASKPPPSSVLVSLGSTAIIQSKEGLLGVGYNAESAKEMDDMRRLPLLVESVDDLHERAKSLQMCGRYEESISDFTAVIMHNPRNAHAYFRRAFAQKSIRQYEQSAEDFERAKELDPSNPDLIVNYRQIHETEVIVLCDAGREKRY